MSFSTYRLQKMLSLKGLLLSTSKDFTEKMQQAGENKYIYIYMLLGSPPFIGKRMKGTQKIYQLALKQDKLCHP